MAREVLEPSTGMVDTRVELDPDKMWLRFHIEMFPHTIEKAFVLAFIEPGSLSGDELEAYVTTCASFAKATIAAACSLQRTSETGARKESTIVRRMLRETHHMLWSPPDFIKGFDGYINKNIRYTETKLWQAENDYERKILRDDLICLQDARTAYDKIHGYGYKW